MTTDNNNYCGVPQEMVLIYSLSALDSFRGSHLHTVSKNLLSTTATPSQITIPANTIIQYGTILNLFSGNFHAGINEQYRLEKIGGDIGIASRAVSYNTSYVAHETNYVVNDEATILGNKAYYGDINGTGYEFSSNDDYSFLQVASLENAVTLNIESATNLNNLSVQIGALLNTTSSFVASFTGMLNCNSKSKTITGFDNDGVVFKYLRDSWANSKFFNSSHQPEVAHLIDFTTKNDDIGLVVTSPIKTVPIYHHYVHEEFNIFNHVRDISGMHIINGETFRDAGGTEDDAGLSIFKPELGINTHKDTNGNTALHVVANKCHLEAINYAIDILGANKAIVNNAGDTPADVASHRHCHPFVLAALGAYNDHTIDVDL